MKVLSYGPWVKLYIYISRPYLEKDKVVDVSQHIISGSVTLALNQTHMIQFTLANPDGRYTNVFLPNDKIVLFLCRNKPVQVFTGFLNSVPVRTARPNKEVSFTGSCTLKHLATYYWDPWLQIHRDYFQRQTPEVALKYVLTQIAGWKEDNIDLQPLKDTEWFKRMIEDGTLYIQSPALVSAITNKLNLSASGNPNNPDNYSSAVADVGEEELTNPHLIDTQKLHDFMVARNMVCVNEGGDAPVWKEMGEKHNVNPALSIAIAMHESNGITRNNPRAVFYTHKYNPWGWKAKSGWRDFSSWADGIDQHLGYLAKGYLSSSDPWGFRQTAQKKGYTPGTIKAIGIVYCENADAPGGWIVNVTKNYTEIMSKCGASTMSK